ncbi:putative syntaxin 5 [Besnoitia besnoiti]|uniref:Putative syntaxin 5 n=1 Tax=Besnoitia besnoiti TaxID=94643 RepID=A0A2A9MHI3_BESBE|nr:putative syntaxin 5 [Besnoitia besnoiti]PFH35113.1 putative syntaxin 5 [Besnoitia besnoiti]
MPCDRTADFLAFAERASPGAVSQAQELRSRSVRHTDNSFNASAAEIGTQLQRTSLKLKELAKFARQRSIYNDKTAQAQDLTYEIKKSITELNIKIEHLEEMARNSRNDSGQSRQHYNTMTDMLKGLLLDVTKEFKDVLLLRTENMKKQDERRNLYSFTGTLNPSTSMYGKTSDEYDLEGGEKMQLTAQRGASAYAQSRAEAVENVQRVIGELATIFQRVATMISHQDEMIQRIDQDIDNSMHNIRQGQTELLNYFHRISSNRALILKVFAILFAFIVFFVFFLS